MTMTVLEPEGLYPDQSLETQLMPGVRLLAGGGEAGLDHLPDSLCAEVEGLFVFRNWLRPSQVPRFPRLKVVVRMGVGYDRLARAELNARGVQVCNVPDYGTAEVCDHAMALALALRRGIALHHDWQRGIGRDGVAPWMYVDHPLLRRAEVQGFGILGLGRIGTAVALRAKAFGFRVVFHDPYLPNGVERALGVARVRTLDELMAASDILSIHTPLTRTTRGLVGARELALLPEQAVVVNTARGPILDLEALEAGLRSGRIAGAGLDVLPEEPPPEPARGLLACYRAREPWLTGRLVVTPHSAFHTPEAWEDIRRKAAETMRDVLLEGRHTNVIHPEAE